MNREEAPFKRRRRMTSILMLPDDLLLNCLARVSRLYYPTLSLVSKRFRSLLASTELYQTRTLLGRTETCLYVCFWLHGDSSPLRCFTLARVPNSSKLVLVPVSSRNSPSASCSDVAVVGPNIYAIGGLVNIKDKNARAGSSSVVVMDCYSHQWQDAPSMRVPRVFQSSCVHDGKIYVSGGSKNLDSTNWMEVFDTKTQTWEFLKIPSEEICKGSKYKSAEYEGTVYVRSEEKDVTYKLYKGRWRAGDLAMNFGWGDSSSYCVIENVFYRICPHRETVVWYDSKNRLWQALKGLLPRLSYSAKLMDYGGKMVILWQENGSFVKGENGYIVNKKIWCAEIAIEIRQNGEIWGISVSSDVVFSTNESYRLEHVLATTI